jgi:FkbM family methyltransferase
LAVQTFMASLFDRPKALIARAGIFLLSIKLIANWHAALTAYLLKKPVNIKFRNGIQGYFGSSTIYKIVYYMGRNVSLKPVSDGILEVSIRNHKFRAPATNVDTLEYVFLNEVFDGGVDYSGKTVLDVGAYVGDTATYFWNKGASKVICYEPIKEFFYWLGQNVELNGINAELYNLGVSDKHGEKEIIYSELNCLVGSRGNRIIKIETLSLSEVLQKHGRVDICKFVSPGCEQAILNLSDAELLRVPAWFVETTSKKYEGELSDKFSQAGFKSKRITKYNTGSGRWRLLAFELD